ncbi:holo-ACP synthase [Bogoriella caseilytica]|uniref:Holo-[acyl-carrier-protein] synthase n=1 Tax=Bogoriella caseilytica TaxID=56055 RepID=A0A3N2BE95_9MICO|nr:holo-ACP synthase [Bogoriella caseilytica]ROR73581.1 holo-[acyl-carrier protein] synthase [Bogoriella caseilytica]
MIVAIGVDLCAVRRLAERLERAPRLAERLFTAGERGLPVESLAARFAAKEAVAKALGSPGGLSWQDCEVRSAASGAPEVHLRGAVAARAEELGITHWHLSLSHDGGAAIAMVVAER